MLKFFRCENFIITSYFLRLPQQRKAPARFISCYTRETLQTVALKALDCVITALHTSIEPSDTTKHLTNVEEFIITRVQDAVYVENFFRKDIEDYLA